MKEKHLHYIWKNKLFDRLLLCGHEVEVLSVGEHNHSDGPDFQEARLRWDGLLWIGSVELHLKTSDWYSHRHDTDPLYSSLILHITVEGGDPVRSVTGREIPTASLGISPSVQKRLEQLAVPSDSLRCMPEIGLLPPSYHRSIWDRMLLERWGEKVREVSARLDADSVWALLYRLLLRYLGAYRNNDAMEQLACSLPLTVLRKHVDDLTTLEALLLGQGGWLSNPPRDVYEAKLWQEYVFYKQKFSLTPLPTEAFRSLRVRPATHPARMLAVAARLLHEGDELIEAILSLSIERMEKVLSLPPSVYWSRHYDIAKRSAQSWKGVGKDTVRSLIINAALPTAFVYYRSRGDDGRSTRSMELLRKLSAESNYVTRLFTQNGLPPTNAAESQALLHMYRKYCTPYRCLACPIAKSLLKALQNRGKDVDPAHRTNKV